MKFGPFSSEIVIACCVYENEMKTKSPMSYSELVEELQGVMSKSTITKGLSILNSWGILRVEFGKNTKGRVGRLYSVSNGEGNFVVETYNKFWDQISFELKK